MEKYLPLRMVEAAIRMDGEDNAAKTFYKKGILKEEISDEKFCEFLFGKDFLNPDYKGPCEPINRWIIGNKRLLHELTFNLKARTYKQKVTEIMDLFGISPVMKLWSRWKKVYKVDEGFLNELIKTDNVKVPRGILRRLPFSTFYIDFGSAEAVSPINGAFVRIINIPDGENVVIYMITNDCITFSYYSELKYGEDDLAVLSDNLVPESGFLARDMSVNSTPVIRNYQKDCRAEVVRAIFQVLMFLASETPDITENEGTKKTYKPSDIIRNKYSEIQMWDVGVRYGKAIKIAKQEAKTAEEMPLSEQEDETLEPTERSLRKRPRPHVRCAHWQRYHVGQGRNEIRINWVPPVIVLGNKSIPVTIQKIEEKRE